MATSNFHNVNTSRIFANEIEDEFDFEILRENLTDRLNELQLADLIKKSKGSYFGFNKGQGNDITELRSFSSTVVGKLWAQHEYKDINIEVELISVIRSGYYSGCNLDFDIVVKVNDFECDREIDAETIEYACDYSPKKLQQYVPLVNNKIEKLTTVLIDALETVYNNISTPLIVAARFSNGETIYRAENQSNQEAISNYINNVI